jgi:DNA gyrase/topoisomerase IV, subunit A
VLHAAVVQAMAPQCTCAAHSAALSLCYISNSLMQFASTCASAALSAVCIRMHLDDYINYNQAHLLCLTLMTYTLHALLVHTHTLTLLYNAHNSPRDVLENLRRRIRQEPMVEMQPWFRGFVGTIKKKAGTTAAAKAGYTTEGIVERTGPETVEIIELPIKRWTQDYKVMLEVLHYHYTHH